MYIPWNSSFLYRREKKKNKFEEACENFLLGLHICFILLHFSLSFYFFPFVFIYSLKLSKIQMEPKIIYHKMLSKVNKIFTECDILSYYLYQNGQAISLGIQFRIIYPSSFIKPIQNQNGCIKCTIYYHHDPPNCHRFLKVKIGDEKTLQWSPCAASQQLH